MGLWTRKVPMQHGAHVGQRHLLRRDLRRQRKNKLI
jgi:hypothetical protein